MLLRPLSHFAQNTTMERGREPAKSIAERTRPHTIRGRNPARDALESNFTFRWRRAKVTLLRDESTPHPFALAIAAAWCCYGGKPAKVETVRKLIEPAPEGLSDEKAADRDGRRERAMKLYADLFAAGHHTTLQHANFVFVLDNVSRLAIWSFFHAHPFYNSEQVSQRYREVTGETDGHARSARPRELADLQSQRSSERWRATGA